MVNHPSVEKVTFLHRVIFQHLPNIKKNHVGLIKIY